MLTTILLLFVGLELKHYIADYFLQPQWMVAGKGDARRVGGYAHAGFHALLSALVLLLASVPLVAVLAIIAAEFVVHYGLDFAKIRYSRGVTPDGNPKRFWSLHGLDQIFHQLTYAAMLAAALLALGLS